FFQVVAMLFDEMLLASADVRDQPECHGQIGAAREEGDLLCDAVFEDLEIIAVEIGGQCAVGIADCEGDVYQMNVYSEWGLGNAGGGQNNSGKQPHHIDVTYGVAGGTQMLPRTLDSGFRGQLEGWGG